MFGKTFCLARMYKYCVEELGVKYLTIAAPSSADLTNVILNGESGIMNAYADDDPNRPVYSPHYNIIKHANGAVARMVSSESPSRSRGINSEVLLCDEASSWVGHDKGREFFHNLLYGLRLGISQALVVTTPSATPLMIELFERANDPDDSVRIIGGSTMENKSNLSEAMIKNAERTMSTRFGRQEILGELILTNDAAAWTPDLLDKCQATLTGEFAPKYWTKVSIGCDPAGDSGAKASDAFGIVVAALTESGKVIVVNDSTKKMTGEEATRTIENLYTKYSQICPVKVRVEANGLGHYFKTILAKANPHMPVESFHSVNKKLARAIACAFHYEVGTVFHDKAAGLGELENECISYDGRGASPNHLDAAVFAIDGLIQNQSFIKRKKFIL